MEVRHRNFSTSRLFGEWAAQHKSWNKMEMKFLLSSLGEEFVVICCIANNQWVTIGLQNGFYFINIVQFIFLVANKCYIWSE